MGSAGTRDAHLAAVTDRAPAARGDLDALIATEAELDQLIADARAAAEHRVAEARAAIAAEDLGIRRTISDQSKHLADGIAASTDARIARDTAAANAAIDRYAEVIGQRLDDVATSIAERLVGLIDPEAP